SRRTAVLVAQIPRIARPLVGHSGQRARLVRGRHHGLASLREVPAAHGRGRPAGRRALCPGPLCAWSRVGMACAGASTGATDAWWRAGANAATDAPAATRARGARSGSTELAFSAARR